jgi:hypothetical protein
MKSIFTTSCAIFLFRILFAQNTPPVVNIQQVNVDTVTKTILVNFDALDAQNDNLEITIKLSADSGKSFLAPMQSVTGDVGFPVTPGTGKTATITYNTDSLMAAANGNPQSWFMVRITANDKKLIDIQSIVDQVDSAMVMEHMQFLAIPRNHSSAPEGLTTLRDSVENIFTRLNLQTARSAFSFGTVGGVNLWGRKPGHVNEKATIIVDGHYDAVANTPGADDNASAMAATLISSKILSAYNYEKTLKFLAFDKEENGLIGSGYYVSNSIPSYEKIEIVLNSEMIGYYKNTPNTQLIPNGFGTLFPFAVDSITSDSSRGKWLFVVGNNNSNGYTVEFDQIARQYVPGVNSLMLNVPGNGQIAPDLRRSDHAKFWDAGYKALMLTDGADFRNANYHKPTDVIDSLNIPFLTRNIKAVIAAAATWAKPISAGYATTGAWQLIGHLAGDEQFATPPVWEVFPNPVNHFLYVRMTKDVDNLRIRIVDMNGRLVRQSVLKTNAAGESMIAIHDLKPGVYNVELSGMNFSSVKKFIISDGHAH